jgi:DNA (cytosine-5)-methyltransferase 1
VAQDDNKTPEAHMAMKQRMKGGPRKKPTSLQVMVKGVERGMWPTPKSSPSGPDYARANRPDSGADDLATAIAREQPTGQLNPTWVEWLMGFPQGWTDLEA